jgi:hypothetical protein
MALLASKLSDFLPIGLLTHIIRFKMDDNPVGYLSLLAG